MLRWQCMDKPSFTFPGNAHLAAGVALSLIATPGHARQQPGDTCLNRVHLTFDTIYYFTDDHPGFLAMSDSIRVEDVWATSVFPQQHTVTLDLCAGTITGLNFSFATAEVRPPTRVESTFYMPSEWTIQQSIIFYVEDEAFYFFKIDFPMLCEPRVLFHQFTEQGVAGFVAKVHVATEEALAEGP